MDADAERADELQKEFQKGFDGIFKRVWPNLAFIKAVSSGSFEIYAKKLSRGYGQGILFNSGFYGATEGLLGKQFPVVMWFCYFANINLVYRC